MNTKVFVGFVAVLALAGAVVCQDQPFTVSDDILRSHNDKAINAWGPETVQQYAGYINVNKTHGAEIFYWMFESRGDPKNDPFVLWMTGGPGCSSLVALFYENGPYRFDENKKVVLNPNSWNTNANILFIDQPVGTGFSFVKNPVDYVLGEKKVADDMYEFLQGFFQKYPQYAGLDFHITGESYAGHYIPAVAARVVEGNKNKEGPVSINLKGIAIGNGWTSPVDQYPAYATFAHENKLVKTATYEVMKNIMSPACVKLIEGGLWPLAMYECQLITMTVLGVPVAPRFNVYDIRKKCDVPPLCYDMSGVDDLLADTKSDLRAFLGVGDKHWKACNMLVHTLMLGDWVKSFAGVVPGLLKENVRVLVYSGDQDFICNWRGGEAWTHNLDWPKKDDFNKLEYKQWGKSGQFKTVDNFTFLRVNAAGHMVPMDQPEAALDMLTRHMKGSPFDN